MEWVSELVGWLGVASGPLPNILVAHKCRGFQNSVRVFSVKVESTNQIWVYGYLNLAYGHFLTSYSAKRESFSWEKTSEMRERSK